MVERIQRKRTKGWKMPLDFLCNVGILHLWLGAKEYHQHQSFAYVAVLESGINPLLIAKAKNTQDITINAEKDTMNIDARNVKSTLILPITNLNKEKKLNEKKHVFFVGRYWTNLAVYVSNVAIKIIECCKSTTYMAAVVKKENSADGLIEKVSSGCRWMNLIFCIKFFVQIVTPLKHGGQHG